MPEQPSAVDRVRSLLLGHARALADGLAAAGSVPRPEAAVEAGGGWTVLAFAMPTPAGEDVPGLTDCDRDCLLLLTTAPEPLSAARVRRELEKRGLAVWSLISVKRSLAKLKRWGLLGNRRRAPRGYYLPENLPLFRHLCRP
jgi:hypothetical protein